MPPVEPSSATRGRARLAAGVLLAVAAALAAWWWKAPIAERAGAVPPPRSESASPAVPEPFLALPMASAAARTSRAPEPEPTTQGDARPAAPASAPEAPALGLVRGIIRDPHRVPVVGAQAGAENLSAAISDAEGRFALEIPAAKPVAVYATAEGLGPSAVRELSVAAGAELSIELLLTAEAVLAGIVLDSAGRPEPEVRVNLGSLRGDPRVSGPQRTDPDGHFEFRGLAAGTYWVSAGETEPDEEPRPLRLRQVTLAEGEKAEVVLGGTERAELTLSIRVTLDGAPFGNGQVVLLSGAEDLLERVQSASLDGQGLAEFRVQRGRHLVNVNREGAAWPVTRTVELDSLAPAALEIALPTGRISGRVLGPSGPLAGREVRTVRQEHWNPLGLGQGPRAVTAADGSFACEGLEAGRYSLRAPGARPIFDVELGPDGRCDGLLLLVEPTGSLQGRVLDPSGAPRSRASVYVRGPEGRWLAHWVDLGTELESGAFELDDLPPGDYTLLARHGELACAESEPVSVVAGETRDVELRLEPGAMLRLALVESDGAPTASAEFRVFDAFDRSCDEPRSVHDLEILLAEGLAPNTRAIGPLAPGSYRIEARGPAGRIASAPAVLAAGWNELTLRLP